MTDTRRLAETYIRSLEARDWDTVIELQSPDVVYDMSPSREGGDGHDDLLRFDQQNLGDWNLTVNRIVADDDQAVIWVSARVGDVRQTANIWLDFGEDGKIVRVTDFRPRRTNRLPAASNSSNATETSPGSAKPDRFGSIADMTFSLRPATAQDIDFLTDMLVEASDWQGENVGGQAQHDRRTKVLADPKVAGYIDGWVRDGDAGLVAVDTEQTPIGASWIRLFTQDAPAFGFVSPEVPELAIGLARSWRGKGIGRQLLREVVTMTRRTGYDRLSLSVDRENPAMRLYAGEGFEVVETRPTAVTMLKTL